MPLVLNFFFLLIDLQNAQSAKTSTLPHAHAFSALLVAVWFYCRKKKHASDEVVSLALNKSGFCVVFNKIPLSLLKGSNEQ